MRKYGYARVSTKDQNPDRQLESLVEYGVEPGYIFTDMLSGKDFDRPEYQRLVNLLKKGDVLVVKSIDRLGRNYAEIIEQWRMLCREREIDIEVIDFPLLNTNQNKDGLTGIFISDMVLQVLAYVAQTERENIRQRQAEGIAIAKAKGIKFGIDKKELPDMFEVYSQKCLNGEVSTRNAAKAINMSHSTFYRRYKEWLEKNCFK